MKRKLVIFLPLIVLILAFAAANYRSVQGVDTLEFVSVGKTAASLTVTGTVKSAHRDVYSVKTETEGNICYVTVTGANSLMPKKREFKASVKNTGNSVKYVYFRDGKTVRKVWENPDFGQTVAFENTVIS